MCCALRIETTNQFTALEILGLEIQRRVDKTLTTMGVGLGVISLQMNGTKHSVSSESWIASVKTAISLYDRAREQGISVTLKQIANPCSTKIIGEKGQEADVSKLCRAALHGVDIE